jgi:hypothetical protein
VDQCYLIGNPWNGVAPRSRVAPRIDVGRSFTQAQWAFIEDQLSAVNGYASPEGQLSFRIARGHSPIPTVGIWRPHSAFATLRLVTDDTAGYRL